MVNILLTLLFDKKNNDKIPKRHYTVNRVRDRGDILLLALFSGQVKDKADSPTPIASYAVSWFLAIGGTPKFKRLLIFRRR
jgi:hypothetical protein